MIFPAKAVAGRSPIARTGILSRRARGGPLAPWLARLHALWAVLAERPCHMLVESGSSGGAHAYWKIAKPLAATRVVEATGELVEPIERANLRLVHRLGVGADGKPDVADPACAERSRVMRLVGTVNGKIRGRGPHGEDPARLTRAPLLSLGSVPVTRRTPR